MTLTPRQLVGTVLPRSESVERDCSSQGVKKMGRERRKTNKLLAIAVVKGMLSINDDTNAETQTITIIATASWVWKEVKKIS